MIKRYNEITMTQENEKILYEWSAPEFSGGGTTGWSGWVFLILIVAAGWTIWTRQWVTLAVVMMIGLIVYLLRKASPRVFQHKIAESGVYVGEKLYPYGKLKSFWIVLGGDVRAVNLLPNKKFGLLLTLQLGDADVEMVRETLKKFLPEEASRGEDTVDKVGRFFKL